ncbi:olfactory receptor 6J1-like [Erinaceus europaeus]|uniref:Olfactory receptor n=1 Tax=Erinaceus europaeus TaxID=9365 RepID=A0A1S3ANQ6_ERIEU|nr:olfactory receptor 6J1-like [Erinaceus europaeus]
MALSNKTMIVTEFILLGFHTTRDMKILLFIIFLIVYVLTVLSNTVIILLVWTCNHLHSPMYLFLANLSFLEIMLTSSVIPKMLAITISQVNTISFEGCIAQSFFYFLFGTIEFFILAIMSFDRYVAICIPLRYPTIMRTQVCLKMMITSWVGGLLYVLLPSIVTIKLPFCGPNVIDHFFCDSAPMLKLVCGDLHVVEMVHFICSAVLLLSSLFSTLTPYIFIVFTIARIPSSQGQWKAFSTCASHMIVVTIFYGVSIFLYARPSKGNVLSFNKVGTVLNTIVTPLMNPFIYTLRNQVVIESLRQTFAKLKSFLTV